MRKRAETASVNLCAMPPGSQRIFNRTFLILSAATFCFFIATSVLVPVLPRHVEDLGGSLAVVGLVNGIMWVPAIILRPFVGRHMDRRGRRPFILIGTIISVAAGVGYAVSDSITVIFIIRLFHGASFACYYPSSTTMVADVLPASRRAEAFSYFSMFLFAGLALGPAIGEHLYQASGADAAFIAGAVASAAAMLLVSRLPETFRGEEPEAKVPLLHRAAAFPALILGLVAFGAAAADAFLPLYVSKFGDGDSRLYFTTFAVTIIAVRFFTGRIADRFGRGAIIVPGAFLSAAAMFVLAGGADPAHILWAAVLRGIGWGALFPGLFAMLMDRIRPGERGSATGTFTAAFDLSFGGGQILLGAILQATSFDTIFVLGGISGIAGGIVWIVGKKRSEERFPPLDEVIYPADGAASASS